MKQIHEKLVEQTEFLKTMQALANDKEFYLQTIKGILRKNRDMTLKKTQ